MKEKSVCLNRLIILTSLCLYLSAIEYAIPKPLPFMKLGLSNLPVILSLLILNPIEYLFLVVLKILGQGILSGTLFSYVTLFSVSGSAASAFLMFLVYKAFYKRNFVSFLGISVCGALANNLAQIFTAKFIVFGKNAGYIAPVLLISGFITGIAMGIIAVLVNNRSCWFREFSQRSDEFYTVNAQCEKAVENRKKNSLSTFMLIMCILVLLFCMFVKNTIYKWICVLVLLTLAEINRKGKVKLLMPLIIILTLVSLAILTPSGKVLFSIGRLKITDGSLVKGLSRAASLSAMLFASQSFINKSFVLPGKIGNITGQVLENFDRLSEIRIVFKKGSVIKNIDDKFYSIWNLK